MDSQEKAFREFYWNFWKVIDIDVVTDEIEENK